jgi:HEAT repeat protein
MIERFDQNRNESSTRLLSDEGYEGFDGLLRALTAGDVAERSEAAFLLGRQGDRRASDALQVAMRDESARVRVEAALALARLGEEAKPLETLTAELDGAFFEDAPLRAARALALLGDPAGWRRVTEALRSELPSNRMEAVAALPAFLHLRTAEIDPVAELVKASSDIEEIIRKDAIATLSQIDDARAADAVRRAIGNV